MCEPSIPHPFETITAHDILPASVGRGRARNMLCANCGTQNTAGRKFCKECGSPLALACPVCGAANEPGAKFCGECGSSFAATTAATARTAARPPGRQDEPTTERRLVSVLFADLVGFT